MGRYIQGPVLGKSEYLMEKFDAMEIPKPINFQKVPDSMALICVISNGPFEAAGYCDDEREFIAFSSSDDKRPRRWFLIKKELAEKEC